MGEVPAPAPGRPGPCAGRARVLRRPGIVVVRAAVQRRLASAHVPRVAQRVWPTQCVVAARHACSSSLGRDIGLRPWHRQHRCRHGHVRRNPNSCHSPPCAGRPGLVVAADAGTGHRRHGLAQQCCCYHVHAASNQQPYARHRSAATGVARRFAGRARPRACATAAVPACRRTSV